uniref:DUF384 domain-containing protein n=1 Tax=Caenorhabditis japonica TaxID=281687 RepID=A0A8R1I2G7_CAEJA
MSDLEVNINDLVTLLNPAMALVVRRKTMEIVTQLGSPLDGSAGQYFKQQDFALGKAICHLCEATSSDRTETLAALTNFTSGSIEAADFVLANSKCVEIAYTAVALYSSVASRLLVNVSRHFPDRVDQKLRALNAGYVGALLGEIKKSVEAEDEDRAKFVGFTLVNLSVLPPIRHAIVHGEENTPKRLPIVCELLANAKTQEIRECAADVLRNLAFDDEAVPCVKMSSVINATSPYDFTNLKSRVTCNKFCENWQPHDALLSSGSQCGKPLQLFKDRADKALRNLVIIGNETLFKVLAVAMCMPRFKREESERTSFAAATAAQMFMDIVSSRHLTSCAHIYHN